MQQETQIHKNRGGVMNNYGIQRILDSIESMAKEARVTFSNGTKTMIPIRKIERAGKTIRIFFYIPAEQTARTITRVELIDNRGSVLDEQTDVVEVVRRQGFMTAFEYTYSEVK